MAAAKKPTEEVRPQGILNDNVKQIIAVLVNFALEKLFEYLEKKQVMAVKPPDAPPQPQVMPVEPPTQPQ